MGPGITFAIPTWPRTTCALRVTETGRPAWVRASCARLLAFERAKASGSGDRDVARVSTRFVLDLTEISDGKQWHKVSGRAITIVTGDRSEILAGQSIEAAGLLAPDRAAHESRANSTIARFSESRESACVSRSASRKASGAGLATAIRGSRGLLGRIRSGRGRGSSSGSIRRSLRWPPRSSWASARESSPKSTTHSREPARLTCWRSRGFSCRHWPLRCWWCFDVAGVARRPAYIGVGLAMVGYAFVVGPAPSVVRATVMTATFCLASISRRLNRPANTLALAGLGTLAVNPSYLFDVGCQLSFLAIGALIWLVPPAAAFIRAGHRRAAQPTSLGRVTPLDELEREFEPGWRRALRRAGGVRASTAWSLRPWSGWRHCRSWPCGFI